MPQHQHPHRDRCGICPMTRNALYILVSTWAYTKLAHHLRNTASLVCVTRRATLVNPDWAHGLLITTFTSDERDYDRIRVKMRVLRRRHWSKRMGESWIKDRVLSLIIYIVMQNHPLCCFVGWWHPEWAVLASTRSYMWHFDGCRAAPVIFNLPMPCHRSTSKGPPFTQR